MTEWSIDWPLLAGLIALTGAYLWAVGPARARFGGPSAFPRGKAVMFLAGIWTIGLAIMSPIGTLADVYLFTMHMIQHLMLTIVAAPLILAGTPPWLYRWFTDRVPGLYTATRWLTNPFVAYVLFNGIFSGWHLPQLYDLALRNEFVHILEHQLMTGTAVLLWCPSLCPLPELRLAYPLQIIYYFLNSVVPTVLGALITFTSVVLYPTYALAPRIWGIDALSDQKIGALIMWIPGGAAFLVALTIAFFRWLQEEDHEDELVVSPGS